MRPAVAVQQQVRDAGNTFGVPVVPEVYMMVQMSSALGGTAAAGCALPTSRNSCQLYTLKPSDVAACQRSVHRCQHACQPSDPELLE